MEAQIIFKEIIKPTCSIPEHPRNYNLSLLDQLAPPVYIPIILFYKSTGDNSGEKSDHLMKHSFSETLTHFYPLAGRIKDNFSIDCNDEGALYIEAHIGRDMSMVLQDPEIHQLEKLLPCNPHDISSQLILAAQVNHFDCGGMALSICIWHAIADISAVASFATSWAAVACGAGATDIKGVIHDCTSIFPPQDIRSFSLHSFVKEELLSKIMMKRFVFDSSMIAALREEVGKGPCLDRPTRVEAVAALIWRAVLALTREEDEVTEINAATIAVGLRKRMIPPLPPLSLGNIYQVAMANCSNNEKLQLDCNGLAGKIHDSIGTMTDDYVRKIHAGGGYFEFVREKSEQLGRNPNLMKVFGFSSWCRFPLYEADFGWGKPIWVGTALKLYKVAIFIDTKDGQGIEAWVSLPREDMLKFQQNPHICAYASFKPST